MFHDLGFEACFYARGNKKEINDRFNGHASTFLWRPQANHFGSQKQILGGYFNNLQTDIDQSPIQDDPTLDKFNAEYKASVIINQVQ